MGLRERMRTEYVPFILVVLIVLGALVFVLIDRWRRGALLLGIALLLGATLRAVLRDHQVGLLAVRNRPVDVVTFAAFGSAIIVLASSISSLGTV